MREKETVSEMKKTQNKRQKRRESHTSMRRREEDGEKVGYSEGRIEEKVYIWWRKETMSRTPPHTPQG